jgi:riboflavin synthase
MFTGIIEDLAEITDIKERVLEEKKQTSSNRRYHTEITINLNKFQDLKLGDSIAINGVCLTIAKVKENFISFQIIDETIKNTNLFTLKKRDRVNIERSLKIGERLEGHFVLGHVDGIGEIKKIEEKDKEKRVTIEIKNKQVLPFIVRKGSIAVDGISLTVVKVFENEIEIALIPHTVENTTLGIKNIGDFVNIEPDILARYTAKQQEKEQAYK